MSRSPLPKFSRRNRTMSAQLQQAQKRYHIGITQGGSAKKFGGAKVSAKNALLREGAQWIPKTT